jgi:hypothetical protein
MTITEWYGNSSRKKYENNDIVQIAVQLYATVKNKVNLIHINSHQNEKNGSTNEEIFNIKGNNEADALAKYALTYTDTHMRRDGCEHIHIQL